MSRDLYQKVILEHNKSPRNFGELEDANREAEGLNRSCGDSVKIFIKINDENLVEAIQFTGKGCAISQASASLLTAEIKAKTLVEAEAIIEAYDTMVKTGTESDLLSDELSALSGVYQYPSRIKCTTLSAEAVKGALSGDANVSTE